MPEAYEESEELRLIAQKLIRENMEFAHLADGCRIAYLICLKRKMGKGKVVYAHGVYEVLMLDLLLFQDVERELTWDRELQNPLFTISA